MKVKHPFLIILFVSIFRIGILAVEPNTAAKLPSKERFHLYLLIGQSNMAGRGKQSPEYQISNDRLLKLSAKDTWEPATEPLHFDHLALAGQTTGLGMSFARIMAEKDPDIVVGVIPCAVGGTPLSRWVKGADLYEEAVRRAKLAIKDGTLKGILWHQGETDAKNEKASMSYGERLKTMISDLRADLGAGDVPFVAGELGEYLEKRTEKKFPFWQDINRQLAELQKSVPKMGVADSSGLGDKGDLLHFNTPALREFGKRYATELMNLESIK